MQDCLRAMWLVAAVTMTALTSSAAAQDVTISDWTGREVTVSERRVDSGGVSVVYHTAGEGPLVVFVHSITGPWFDWRHQIPALAERFQVAAMSTRGTNQSDKPEGVEHYTVAKIADDIEAIIDDLGHEKAVVVGQDSGGFYAWNFAMTRPDRTERLVAIGSVHPAGLLGELADNPDQRQASRFQRGMQESPEAATAFGERVRSRPERPGDTEELTRLRREAFERLYVESIVNFYKANWPRPPFSRETEGFGFRIGEFPPVTVPTLVIYGKNDGAFLPGTIDGLASLVEAPLAIDVLPEVGHAPHTQVPEYVTPRVVEWLAQ